MKKNIEWEGRANIRNIVSCATASFQADTSTMENFDKISFQDICNLKCAINKIPKCQECMFI